MSYCPDCAELQKRAEELKAKAEAAMSDLAAANKRYEALWQTSKNQTKIIKDLRTEIEAHDIQEQEDLTAEQHIAECERL